MKTRAKAGTKPTILLHGDPEKGYYMAFCAENQALAMAVADEYPDSVDIFEGDRPDEGAVNFGMQHPTLIRSFLENDMEMLAVRVVFAPDLVPHEATFHPPVDQLLRLGPKMATVDYAKFGLTTADVPELIRLATHAPLFQADDDRLSYAPVHACEALIQMRVPEAVEALLATLPWVEDDTFDVWSFEHLPSLFGKVGRPAVEPCRDYIADKGNSCEARQHAIWILGKLGGRRGRALYDVCVEALCAQLAKFAEQSKTFNGKLINVLGDLEALEAIPLIDAAFRANQVDIDQCGSWRIVRDLLDSPLDDEEEQAFSRLDGYEEEEGPDPDEPWGDSHRGGSGSSWVEPQPFIAPPKIGRNDPCPCGSGKKYQKCCG